jgi:hypothetical protein
VNSEQTLKLVARELAGGPTVNTSRPPANPLGSIPNTIAGGARATGAEGELYGCGVDNLGLRACAQCDLFDDEVRND